MNFVVLGAGAMGSLFGGYLAQASAAVTLVDVNETHIRAIREKGLIVDRGDGRKIVEIQATTNPSEVELADIVIVFCKYLNTETALSSAAPYITPDTYIWTLQNGIGNVDVIANFVKPSRVVKGLTSATAILQAPGQVSTNFKGETETYYWPLAGSEHPILAAAAETLTCAGLPTIAAPDIDYRIWRKLVINATLTIIAGFNNTRIGDAYFNEPGRSLCEDVVSEVVAVAQAAGVSLELDDALGYLNQLANSAVEHVGSTTVSLQLKQRTEVDTMNGAVVREGKKYGVPTPVNETITKIVKLVEETSGVRLSPPV